ncbi:MAG: hypothetical protein ACKVP1_04340, partial [Burkholderiaceae bacterium]
GAWTMLGEKKIFLFDSRKRIVGRYADSTGKPGEITQIGDTSIIINAQGGHIEVLKLRAEDGKKMGAADWARAQGLASASRFG